MSAELTYLKSLAGLLTDRLRVAHHDEGGAFTTETVLVTALLAALALAAVAVIANAVMSKAESIPMGG